MPKKKPMELKGHYTMVCAQPGCKKVTAHPDPKYVGPCHSCIRTLGAFKIMTSRSAKMARSFVLGNQFNKPKSRWSF